MQSLCVNSCIDQENSCNLQLGRNIDRPNMLTRQRKQRILSVLQRDGSVVAKSLQRGARAVGRHASAAICGSSPPKGCCSACTAVRCRSPGPRPTLRAACSWQPPRRWPSAVPLRDWCGRGRWCSSTAAPRPCRWRGACPKSLRATVVTHSPSVAVELAGHVAVEVVLIGGRLFRRSMVAVGAAAMDAVSRIQLPTPSSWA